jgi:DHA1 family bicyclomycin/chloramphenicol resistance-like MFS transporter
MRLALPGGTFTVLLLLLLGAQPIATDLYLPALPAITRDLGPASTSLTVFALAFGISQLFSGPLADRWGRRPLLLAGLALYAVGALGATVAGSIAVLAGWRAVQGVAMAAILICARAAVRDRYSALEGPRVMALGLSGLGVVALLAPLLGAVMTQYASWRWALACMTAYALVVLVWCALRFTETRPARTPGGRQGSAREVLRNANFWAWSSLTAATYGGIFCFLLLSPMVYVDRLGLSPLAYGWIPASGSLVYTFSTAWCRHLLHRRTALSCVRLGAGFSLAGAVVQLAGALWWPDRVAPLLLGHWIFVIGHGFHQPCSQAGAVSELPQAAGRAVAWSGFITMAVAFALGQTVAHFSHGADGVQGLQGPLTGTWPVALPMALAGLGIWGITRFWLPRVRPSSHA